MQKDYSVTIFSRYRGKTRTFGLNRRVLYLPLVVLIILLATCILLWHTYSHEREGRQRLEKRVALLEQLANKFAERSERRGGTVLAKRAPKPANQAPAMAAPVAERKEPSERSRPAEIQKGGRTEVDLPADDPIAKIDDLKAGTLDGDRAGFRLDFKLINLTDEPISGNVAIIASLRPPHQPRFVSFPSMKLVDGMPVQLRKSVGFNIRYFKYITGRFYFPFSHSDSFRILVYNRDVELILDSTLVAEEVTANGLVAEEPTQLVYPSDPSLSS